MAVYTAARLMAVPTTNPDNPTNWPRLQVSVTAEDIAGAKHGDSYECVLVIALARTLARAYKFRVDEHTIRFTLDGYRFQYRGHPWRVEDYVRDFDAGVPPKPFTFWVHKPKVTVVAKRSTGAAKIGKRPRTGPEKARISSTKAGDATEHTESAAAELTAAAAALKPGRGRPVRMRTYGNRQGGASTL